MEEEEACDVMENNNIDCSKERIRYKEMTNEEKLAEFEQELKKSLEDRLKRIDFEKKKEEIRKRFEAEHKAEIDKIKEDDKRKNRWIEHDDVSDNTKWLSDEEIANLKKRYKELEARQIEILDQAVDPGKINDLTPGNYGAIIEEYLMSEKLKLVLIDRIRGNLHKRELRFGFKTFAKNSIAIETTEK